MTKWCVKFTLDRTLYYVRNFNRNIMKKLLFVLSMAALFTVACSNDQKTTPQEQKKVEDQVAKDQAGQDSMEKVIQQQIEATLTDTVQ